MSINTKSKIRMLARRALSWRKACVLVGAMVLSPSLPLLMFYVGFWLARWTYGLKIVRTKKQEAVLDYDDMQEHEPGDYP